MAQIIETATGTIEKVDVDPVTLDLIENGLRNARYEMDEVLFRTALSPGIREQHDEFPLIGDPDGKMVVGQFGLSIPDFLDGFDDTIEEGDVLLTSDPYACGAAISHANDWLIVVPIFKDGRVVGLGVDVRAHVRRGRQDAVVHADRRPHHLRGGRGHPALQALPQGRAQRRRAADHPQPGPQARLEPRRPQRPGRRLPHRRPPGGRDVRPVRHRHLPLGARRAAAAQLRRHEGAAVDGVRGGPHALVHRLHLRRRRRQRPVRAEAVADPHRRQGAPGLHRLLARRRPGRSTTTSTRT